MQAKQRDDGSAFSWRAAVLQLVPPALDVFFMTASFLRVL